MVCHHSRVTTRAKPRSSHQVLHPPGHHGDRRPASHLGVVGDDPAQGWPIEVIHMRVGKQHHVNGRQILDPDSRPAQAPQRDQPFGEDRVDQQLTAADLDQERRVANERDPQLPRRNQDGLLRFSGHRPEGRLAHQRSQRLHLEENRALALDPGFHRHPDYLIDSPARLRDAISDGKVPHGDQYCGTSINRRDASRECFGRRLKSDVFASDVFGLSPVSGVRRRGCT